MTATTKKSKLLSIVLGSVSSGTLKSEDLKESFETELEYYQSQGIETSLDEYNQNCVDDLTDKLSELAPDYCYFGTLEGDGADFGFWVSWDMIRDGIHDKEILKVDDMSEDDETSLYVLHVNDHGNSTLYGAYNFDTLPRPEIWSIV